MTTHSQVIVPKRRVLTGLGLGRGISSLQRQHRVLSSGFHVPHLGQSTSRLPSRAYLDADYFGLLMASL
jgi:hypothetical protein